MPVVAARFVLVMGRSGVPSYVRVLVKQICFLKLRIRLPCVL